MCRVGEGVVLVVGVVELDAMYWFFAYCYLNSCC